jgi:DNA polymerase/3'-5' exonuclease PolX
MPFEEANGLAKELKDFFMKNAFKVEIVGSIRRKRPIVNDLDFVVIPKMSFYNSLHSLNGVSILRSGVKMTQLIYKDVQIDIYYANEGNFEVLRLIRTGSAEHNKRLCTEARNRGMILHADGRGLYKGDKMIACTEEGILKTLLGKYIKPEEREIVKSWLKDQTIPISDKKIYETTGNKKEVKRL